MMKYIRLITLVTITLILTGCASHHGSLAGSAVLQEANFNYSQTNITGQAQARYILGIGGMNRSTLLQEAKENMLANHPLQSNQALVNVSVNYKKSNVLFVYKKTICTVSADVVQFK